MMKRIKSNPWMRSKALYVIPVAALALCAFATPKFVAPIEKAVTKLEGKVTEISPDAQVSEEKRKVVKLKEAPRVVVDGKCDVPMPYDAFLCLTCIDGNAAIDYGEGSQETIKQGESVLVPACVKHLVINGTATIITATA